MSKAAIVTGASSGIGLAISRVLCEKGYEVYGFGRDFAKEQTRKFVEQTAAFHPVEGDLLEEQKLCDAVKEITKTADIEVLVNAAGVGHYGLHEELTPKKIQALVRTNLEIPLLLTNRLLRVLKKNHVTREYTVTVSGEAVTQNVKIHLKGDINGDGKVSYIMIQGDPENIDAQLRTEYSVKALTDAGVEVEQLDLQRGDWDRNKGQEICQNDLAKYGDQIEVVFCNNDDMAIGALQAIQAAGRTVNKDIYLVGVDALDAAKNKGVIHKNTAARKISRMAKRNNKAAAAE